MQIRVPVAGETPQVTTFTYDRNGNQLTQVNNGVQQTHTFDAFNRLVTVVRPATSTEPAITAVYTYRTSGIRHSKSVNGVITTHVWERGSIVLERNASGAVINRFHRGRGHLISSDHHGFYVFNVRGDVVQRTDNRGNVINTYRFDAFGNRQNEDVINTNPFRSNAEYYDWETGFIYLRARFYNPLTGRMITEDPYWGIHNMQISPSTKMQSGNLFVFTKNNPIMWIDPSGLRTERVGGYWVTTNIDSSGRTTRSYVNISTGQWAGSFDSGGWSSTPNSNVGGGFVTDPMSHVINAMRYVPGNGWHLDTDTFIGLGGASTSSGSTRYTAAQQGIIVDHQGTFFMVSGLAMAAKGGIAVTVNRGYQRLSADRFSTDRSSERALEEILSRARHTNTNRSGLQHYQSSGGMSAARSDFNALNPTNVRTVNGRTIGDLPGGTTINIHPSTSVGGAPTLEIYNRTRGLQIKIRY